MRWHVIKRHVKNSWRRRWVRVTTALISLAAAICAQYFVSRLPRPQNVEAADAKYTPAKSKVKQQEIVIYNPSLPADRDVLLSFDGKKNQTVAFHGTRAKLSSDTFDFLQELILDKSKLPPDGFEKLDYFVDDPKDATKDQIRHSRVEGRNQSVDEGDDTCRMFISVRVIENKLPTEIRFYQPETGNRHFQTLEITAKDADLEIQMKQQQPPSEKPEGNPWALGCGKTLKVSDWNLPNHGDFVLAFVVAANSTSRFDFETVREAESLAPPGGLFEPFSLGEQSLQAAGVRVSARMEGNATGSSSEPATLEVRAANRKGLLHINNLKEGEDELQLGFSGTGLVKTDGQNVKTASLFDLVNQNPMLAAIFALANAALLGWVTHAVFGKNSSS